jgi:integrase
MTVTGFDVGIYALRRRPGRRRPFEVRWRAAGRVRSRSFLTRALADSYRAELIRAARTGLEFDPATGEPAAWNQPGPVTVTWYEHAASYAAARWPELAAHSRSSLADALATITPALTRQDTRRRPEPRVLRAVLYRHAYCPARPAPAGSDAEQILDWTRHTSLPVTQLTQPPVLRAALGAITMRLDGSRAAPATITRKHAVLHAALGYATETGLLDANPLDTITWRVPRSSTAVNPAVVASPEQVHALLSAVTGLRPDLTAFFGCLYYAALRPEEAVALRQADCQLPGTGWGLLTLTAAAPRTAAAWTSTGTSHELRGLKHRPAGTIRTVPIPPVLAALLRRHLAEHGTAPDGRLFPGTRGGILSESVYGRAWHHARATALGPDLAATPLARRPYDLRHAALSLWLNAGGEPAQIAARAGNSVHVLLTVYTHCIHDHDRTLNQHITTALQPPTQPPHQLHAIPDGTDQPWTPHPPGNDLAPTPGCPAPAAPANSPAQARRQPRRPHPSATTPVWPHTEQPARDNPLAYPAYFTRPR